MSSLLSTADMKLIEAIRCFAIAFGFSVDFVGRSVEQRRRLTVNVVDILAILIQLTSFIVWPLISRESGAWLIPISVFLISLRWWENYITDISSYRKKWINIYWISWIILIYYCRLIRRSGAMDWWNAWKSVRITLLHLSLCGSNKNSTICRLGRCFHQYEFESFLRKCTSMVEWHIHHYRLWCK